MADDKERQGFLSRWSQRKLAEPSPPDEEPSHDAVEADALDADEAALLLADRDEAPDESEPEEDEEALENRLAAESVDIDSLQYDDDFKVFLKRGVPKTLKDQALRKLWRSNPVLANLDGLNDYDADYGDPALNVYKSAWALGRGFLSKAEQAAQYASGTFNEPVEETADIEDELVDEDVEVALADGADEDADTSEHTLTAEAEMPDDEPGEVSEPMTEEVAEEPIRRVSLRQRLEG